MNLPDTPELIDALVAQIQPILTPECAFIGIHTGGVWVMEALLARLGASVPGSELPRGELDISFYRDDYSRIGLHPESKPSHIPFEIEGRHLILIDDVLYTGRTVRGAMNLLFDYGRPASVRLAVLIDRGGHELPIAADFIGARLDLVSDQHVSLVQGEAGHLRLELKESAA